MLQGQTDLKDEIDMQKKNTFFYRIFIAEIKTIFKEDGIENKGDLYMVFNYSGVQNRSPQHSYQII